jgi:hypothetical protein
MWRRVDLVLTDVSEERIASIFTSYIAGYFRLVTQSAATWPHWFFAREFFYPEDGGDTFLRNVG